jgi:hypothetical protein
MFLLCSSHGGPSDARDSCARPVNLASDRGRCVEWNEPILVEHELYVGPKHRRVLARIGFPQEIADDEWVCSLQVCGTSNKRRWRIEKDKVIRLLSTDGRGALWNACDIARSLLDRLKDIHPHETPHEFVFPVFLPTFDTRHGIDFYRELTHTLAAEIRRSGIAEPEPTPSSENLAQSKWTGPVLLDERLAFGPERHRVRARIGFPYFLAGDNTWACSFQLEGLEGDVIRRVRGDNGLFAVARATKVIRELFDALEPQSAGAYYELAFPAYLPTVHGLELHQRLRKLLDAERARSLRNQLRAHAARERRERRLAAQQQKPTPKAAS